MLVVLGFLLLLTGARGFGILPGDSQSHLEITDTAILNATVQVCRALAEAEGNVFTTPAQPFTVTDVATACRAQNSIRSFQLAIVTIKFRNVRVDIRQVLNASFHFDDESFVEGRNIIVGGLITVKNSINQEDFEAARENLGTILHPLQDFYSHSNWVENGNQFPNSNLIRSDTSIGNIAAVNRATCRSCNGDDCSDNILEDITRDNVLTSGYFSLFPTTPTKPAGKCSHGGTFDQTSDIDPTGGINKDAADSEHGNLHEVAANLAAMATSEILENIRQEVEDVPFLLMLGISRGSGKALCFVIDTTESMSDDIAAVQVATSSLINNVAGTDNEPQSFILVPFNDPEVGPLRRTTDPQVFNDFVDDLSASGGGDDAERSLAALKLGLMGSPRSSDIFVFTDAPARDVELKTTVIALIERTQSVVNFLITGTSSNRIAEADSQVYRDLAQAAGGLAVEVETDELLNATIIIRQISNSSVVTLLQASRGPGPSESFTFLVDETTMNTRIYITGNPTMVTITNPSGSTHGIMGTILFTSSSVGNLEILELNHEEGTWEIEISSENPFSLRVTDQSPIDFLVDFVEIVPGGNAFDVLDTRPTACNNGSLLVTLTGSDTANVTGVTLVEAAGTGAIAGTVEPQGSGQFLVGVDKIPSVPFVVRVNGTANNPSFEFQRQSPTNFQASNLTIRGEVDNNLVPGTPFSVPFSITEDMGGNFSITVTTNDQRFTTSAPSSLLVQPGVSTNSTIMVFAPLNTPSGTTITLTIDVKNTDSEDTNYLILRIVVFNTVTDLTAPMCEVLSFVNCVQISSTKTWEVSVRVSDGADGTGVERVTRTQGNGTLNIGPSPSNGNVTLVTYNASCVDPDMALVAVDRVGNTVACAFNGFQLSGDVAPLVSQVHLICALNLAVGLLLSLW
ncbi:von Willebrand factor A domain-containing protein 7-like [Nerophis lumbriciformis]|uniref:von Willebrand factor A domain-containing protein 7-like n=1 Tax=Nerophis lumbriciformis TaxID=546530 RepID=UPI002ADF2881|nr:von Willebrand factor A domain-containing protein 7-like [Nerophis lumbriciformis]